MNQPGFNQIAVQLGSNQLANWPVLGSVFKTLF